MRKKSGISIVTEIDADIENIRNQHNEGVMGVLAMRDNIPFPGVVTPVVVGRKMSLSVVQKAEKNGELIAAFMQVKASTEEPQEDDLYDVGMVCRVIHIMQLPDSTYTVLLQALNRVKLTHLENGPDGLVGHVTDYPQERFSDDEEEFHVLLEVIKDKITDLATMSDQFPTEMLGMIRKMRLNPIYVNFICTSYPFNAEDKIDMLCKNNDEERATLLLKAIKFELKLCIMRKGIEERTQADINQQQKDYFINQQIRNLQEELSDKSESMSKQDDITELKEKGKTKLWNKAVAETFEKEVAKLARINVQSPDYNIQLTYLQTMLQLPWESYTPDNLDLKRAQRYLDEDHYGMEKVKERILEHLAVIKLKSDNKSPIICLYGPPGVGKTSLCKSIAKALNRKYVRISLGGMHDESEIRGHRRTYIGAMPGRIIKNIIKAGSSNPVFVLDEIDKVSQNTIHGDPSSALLEVLDPEQNSAFHDNFLDVDYDLSHVMFIATANDIHTIPRPLLDRMELIEVGGYITEEKIEIAKRHLFPTEKEKNGMKYQKGLKIRKGAIEKIIENYTRESGVRSLEKQINKMLRKVALQYVRDEFDTMQIPMDYVIDEKQVEKLLGKPLFTRDSYQGNGFAGVVTGLAWTSVGGEILFIETSVSEGKGGKLSLTGNLGDVMKESATIALEYIKCHALELGIDNRIFEHYNLHIHVPEGAVPKDGPSAGITMVTSIASALTQRKVRSQLAMTGEITLRGKVLPVGGIREKILAAKRAGIKHLILSGDNRKDIEEIPSLYLTGLEFHYAGEVMEVLDFALLEEKVSRPLEFRFDRATL